MKSLLLAFLLVLPVPTPATAASSCPSVVDGLASVAELRQLNAVMAGFGARSTGSPAHQRYVSWLHHRVAALPGVSVTSDTFRINRWQRFGAALVVNGRLVPVAGAIPYTRPGVGKGPLVHLTEPITPANARGKVVLRDFPLVDRGYLAEPVLNRDLTDAGLAGAAGLIFRLPFPTAQMRDYWDPHTGTHHHVPGVFVGSDVSLEGATASVVVLAHRDHTSTRSVVATLPGLSAERIVLDTNTDGTTWVQDSGNAAMLALAGYLSRLPLRCRPRTFEFVFATGHLHRSAEGSDYRARLLDADIDRVAFAFVLEHLGARELLPVDGRLEFTGQAEQSAWFAGSPVLSEAAAGALARRGVDRTFVLPGLDPPVPGRAPPQCSFGGIGTHFHGYLVPTTAMIAGPWSLWAPSFGSRAVDHSRLRQQTLAAGDVLLALGAVDRAAIAGPYPEWRRARAAGAPTCPLDLPPEHAPRPM